MDLNSVELTPGFHEFREGYCMMEAAAIYSGLEWTDGPETVNPDIARLCRAMNDWIPSEAERQKLKNLIPLVTLTGGTYSKYVKDQVAQCFELVPEYDDFKFILPGDPISFLEGLVDRLTFEADMLERTFV